jgi:anti-sigma factor RsiW
MDCRLIQGELIAYHFATAREEERERVDEHLLVCTACLRAYLRLKRHVERGSTEVGRPSDALRDRLRRDVLAAFRPTGRERVRRWLQRPIPLYQGIAAAAVALFVAGAGPILAEAVADREPRTTATMERIDTSRPSPQSLTFY